MPDVQVVYIAFVVILKILPRLLLNTWMSFQQSLRN